LVGSYVGHPPRSPDRWVVTRGEEGPPNLAQVLVAGQCRVKASA
jgi:hypothetical protein